MTSEECVVAQYLNTDLELSSMEDLSPLAEWFQSRTDVLFCGAMGENGYLLNLETSCGCRGGVCGSPVPEGTIGEVLNLLAEVPSSLRPFLDRCKTHVVDVGIEADWEAPVAGEKLTASGDRALELLAAHGFALSVKTRAALDNAGVELRVTLYGQVPER